MENKDLVALAEVVAKSVVVALEKRGFLEKSNPKPPLVDESKTRYEKTEQLLYSYNNLKKLVESRMQDIEDIETYGVPESCGTVREYVQRSNVPHGLSLPEESNESAIRSIKASIQSTINTVGLLEECLSCLENDPYYRILEAKYFENKTQEDIALELNCTQPTVSNNKQRLVKELSLLLFPNEIG